MEGKTTIGYNIENDEIIISTHDNWVKKFRCPEDVSTLGRMVLAYVSSRESVEVSPTMSEFLKSQLGDESIALIKLSNEFKSKYYES